MGHKIAELKDVLDENLNRYHELRTKMNFLRDPIAKRLPVEITTAIFQFCLPKQSSQMSRNLLVYGKEDNARALFTLGTVCRTWRQIIWSTPRFWSHICIPIRHWDIQVTNAIAKDWLSQTEQMPLSVALYCEQGRRRLRDTDKFEQWASEVTELSGIVNATSSRWEYLDINLPAILLQKFYASPSKLRELRVLDAEFDSVEQCLGSLSVNGSPKPMPTYVEIDFVRLQSVDIVWDNVTHLRTVDVTVHDCLEMVRLATKLTECVFLTARFESSGPPLSGPGPIVNHNLRDLKFKDPDDHSTTSFFFGHLSLPRLESITVTCCDEQLLPADSLISLIGRSSCMLRTLMVTAAFEEHTHFLSSESSALSYVSDPRTHYPLPFFISKLFKIISQTTCVSNDATTRLIDPTVPMDQTFLPKLQLLTYSTKNAEDCERIWDMIPDVFSNPDILEESEDEFAPYIPNRPLFSLEIIFKRPYTGFVPRCPNYISKPNFL